MDFFVRPDEKKVDAFSRDGCCGGVADSFPVPTYLFFKGDERLGRNDVKVAGQAGKGERSAAFP